MAALAVALHTIPRLHNTRIEATRTPVPGQREVQLDEGKYVIYYEVGTTGQIGLSAVHGVTVRIGSPSSGSLALHDYEGNFHTGSSYVDARAFLTVQIPRSGTYEISAAGHSSQPIVASAPRIVLGESNGGKILLLVAAGVVALFAFIALCFVAGG